MYIKDRIVDYYVNKSLNYYRVFKNKKAIETINKILIFDKDNVDALSSKGLFYSCLFDKENSFKCYDLVFKKIAKYRFYFQKAKKCIYLMDYDLALDCFNRVLDYHYDDSEKLFEISSCYYYSRDYDCAFHYFNKLLKEKPENTDLLTHVGNCYLYMGDMDLALEYLDKALNIDTDNSFTILSKYCFNMEKEDYSNALIEINKYIKIDDSFPFLIYKYSLADLGHFEVSLKGFERISKIKHDNVKVFNIYYLYYDHALEVMGKYDEAIKIHDEYLDNYNFLKGNIQEAKDNLIEEVF